VAKIVVLGAGYIGAATAALALERGDEVLLADNWHATRREQAQPLQARGARVLDCDVRDRAQVDALLAGGADRVLLLAAQASRPASERDPLYTEHVNLTGPRVVAQAVAAAGVPAVLYGSSLNVYGRGAAGEVGPGTPYGPQGDLAHLTKVHAELCLRMFAERHGFALGLLRIGITYGPSPVEHDDPAYVTVVDKFRRLARAGEPLPLDDGGRATIGAVHVSDVARVLLDWTPDGVEAVNVSAEALTVSDVAALAEGREPAGGAARWYPSPFPYAHRLAEYLAA
jgi:nucleoside-diphosphate-sugar epimerase